VLSIDTAPHGWRFVVLAAVNLLTPSAVYGIFRLRRDML
jgi:hypothetical protein